MMKFRLTGNKLGKNLYHLYLKYKYGKFYKMMLETGGMINPRVYKQLYKEILDLPDLDIVEVGGASGSASIFIAKAMKESFKKNHLIVIEKCYGGTRTKFGDYQTNKAMILNNFRKFEVIDKIIPFLEELTYDNGILIKKYIRTNKISALIHDADGQIDRDFYLFWEMLIPGGLIVIDDYVNLPRFKEISEMYPAGGTKFLKTFHLLNQFKEWGLFEEKYRIGKTIFGAKPENADFKHFDTEVCNKILNEIEQKRIDFLNKDMNSI